MPTLLALLIVATYAAPHRAPDELLESGLHDSVIRVWLGIRSVQGGKHGTDAPPTRYPLSYIGKRCGKSANAVSKALIELKAKGWVEEVGRDAKTPLLRCLVPTGVAPVRNDRRASEESSSRLSGRSVAPVRNHRRASEESSPTPPNKELSGVDPGSDPENNNNTGAQGRERNAPLVLTPEQTEHRRRLLDLDVFEAPAQRIVTTMPADWVALVVRAGEHLARRKRTAALGALVVAMADGTAPLPALDAPSAPPRPGPAPPAADDLNEPDAVEAGRAFAEDFERQFGRRLAS